MKKYLQKLGYSGDLTPSYTLLRDLHRLHQAKIPFENLDILLNKVPALDDASLEAKLLDSPRGGYCFELNLSFARLLRGLGFEVQPRLARVLLLNPDITQVPRTHVWLMVKIKGEIYLADVGFGAGSVLDPVPLVPGAPFTQDKETFQIQELPGPKGLTLMREHRHEMKPLYWMDPSGVFPIDMIQSNFWVATHPTSRFRQGLTLTVYQNQERTSQGDLNGAKNGTELAQQLKTRFGIAGLTPQEWDQVHKRLADMAL
jgi:N-hydroxyarylamine O-acetyltransferase